MNEAIVKEEVIEETCNFTFKNGEYVEVKQEETEQKPENLLENEIKTETIDLLAKNKPEIEVFELKQGEWNYEIEKTFIEVNKPKCEICQKRMPRNRLKLIKLNDEKIVLFHIFKVKGMMEIDTYVCWSHIQKIIDDYDGTLRNPSCSFGYLLRTVIRRNKNSININRTPLRRHCYVCYTIKDCSQLCQIHSKRHRMVILIGCMLRETLTVKQAISFLTNSHVLTCYSHFKESIDRIFERFGVRNVLELSKCSTQAMENLMDIVKKIDPNFTVDQFIDACRGLVLNNEQI
ncbi:hypothetical protein B9Z55_021167 [Caenorhabditis nigoni]|nr:hypothetical protein B9Z55_021167 [Caenorhabditis nigoni]